MEVFTSIYSKNSKGYVAENYGLINDGLRNHSIFSVENVSGLQSHVKSINSLLNDGKTRPSGVQQLVSFLPQCPKSVLSDQGERWMRYLASILGGVGSGEVKIKACQAVSYILKQMDGLQDLQKAISSKQISGIVQTLANAGQEWGPAAFDALTEYVCCFPGQTLSQRTSIEQVMVQYLDFPVGVNDGLVCGAGKVYSALPLPGAGAGTARAEARGQQLTSLVALCHSLQDYLLDGIIEKESYSNSRTYELPLPPLNSSNEIQDPIRTHLKAASRIINAFTFIDELIGGTCNASISLIPHHLISPVIRILQVEGSVVSNYRSQEHQLLAFLLPSLHQAALLLLSNMLVSVGESLDAYWGILADVLATTLKGSNHIMTSTGQSHGQTQQASHIRVICYHTLEILTQVSSGRHSIPHSIVKAIVQDITPQGDSVTLNGMGSGGLANVVVKKKKQRHRNKKSGHAVTSSDISTPKGTGNKSSNIQNIEAHENVVAAALKLAETLFLCAGHSMNHKSIKALQVCVLSVSQWLSGHWWVGGLYRNPKTKSLMYATLNTLVLHPNPCYPPPYAQILHILQQATTSSHSPQVLQVCRSGIASLSFILANPQVFTYEEAVRKVQLSNGNHNNDNDEENDEDDNEDELENEEEEESAEDENKENYVSDEKEMIIKENAEQSKDLTMDCDPINDSVNKESDVSDHNDDSEEEESQDSVDEENEVSQQGNTSSFKIPSDDIDSENKISESPQKSPDTISQKRSVDEVKESVSKKKTKQKAVVSSSGPSLDEMLATFVDANPDD